jgi:hypothetical protein
MQRYQHKNATRTRRQTGRQTTRINAYIDIHAQTQTHTIQPERAGTHNQLILIRKNEGGGKEARTASSFSSSSAPTTKKREA